MHVLEGDSSRQDIQLAKGFRLNDITLTIDHEKDMDNTATLGGFHALCGDRCAPESPSAITTPERAATGSGNQAATLARITA